MSPAVSIIVPAYNASPYIERTIRSVLAQTFSDWELLIVDDGSKDNTAALVQTFSDPRISLIRQPNGGVSRARNNGLSKARGTYVALLDADDEFLPDNLSKKIAALENDPQAGWVFSNLRLIDADSKLLHASTSGKGENILENILLWNGEVIPGPCSNLVFRRELLDAGLAFDPQFSTAADQDFCLQLAARSKGFFLEEALASYRLLPGSMSRNIAVMEKDHTGVYRKAAERNLFRSAAFRRRCFSNLYIILAGSWWVDGRNKTRGLYFMLRAVLTWPPNITKLLRKIF